MIATKAGFQRPGPGCWEEDGRPEHLRQACEGSLRRLKLDRIDLFQLHRIDPKVALEDQIDTLIELQRAGKVRYLGLSEVSVAQIEVVRGMTPIVSVQNRYNLVDRQSEDVLKYCTREKLGFIPWFPWRPATSPGRATRWHAGPSNSGLSRRRSPSRGCCTNRLSCSRSPALPKSGIWKRTPPPPG